MSWSSDGLFLACTTGRGSLILLSRFGQPLSLVVAPAWTVGVDGREEGGGWGGGGELKNPSHDKFTGSKGPSIHFLIPTM